MDVRAITQSLGGLSGRFGGVRLVLYDFAGQAETHLCFHFVSCNGLICGQFERARLAIMCCCDRNFLCDNVGSKGQYCCEHAKCCERSLFHGCCLLCTLSEYLFLDQCKNLMARGRPSSPTMTSAMMRSLVGMESCGLNIDAGKLIFTTVPIWNGSSVPNEMKSSPVSFVVLFVGLFLVVLPVACE